ncbi:hypothetical protein Tco_1131484 [Tanacetum coccineum]
MAEQDIPPPTITAMKIPIIRKGEYDIWSMRMRQYICHTDHNLWDVIVNGDLEEEPAPTTGETSAPPAPKTAKQLAARRNQERVKSILLLAIPDEYLLKFHNVADAKSLWEAIKSRFGGNVESKKMQKNKLISQLEVHGAPISKEDINQSNPVWDNTKRVNHPNFSKYPHLSETFVPVSVSSRTCLHRPSINTARSISTARLVYTARPVSTARPSISIARPVCTARPSISTVRPVYTSRSIYPRMENVRPKGSCSPIKRSYYTKPAFRPKDLKQDIKTFGVKNMTIARKRALVNTGKGKLDTDLKKLRWV